MASGLACWLSETRAQYVAWPGLAWPGLTLVLLPPSPRAGLWPARLQLPLLPLTYFFPAEAPRYPAAPHSGSQLAEGSRAMASLLPWKEWLLPRHLIKHYDLGVLTGDMLCRQARGLASQNWGGCGGRSRLTDHAPEQARAGQDGA